MNKIYSLMQRTLIAVLVLCSSANFYLSTSDVQAQSKRSSDLLSELPDIFALVIHIDDVAQVVKNLEKSEFAKHDNIQFLINKLFEQHDSTQLDEFQHEPLLDPTAQEQLREVWALLKSGILGGQCVIGIATDRGMGNPSFVVVAETSQDEEGFRKFRNTLAMLQRAVLLKKFTKFIAPTAPSLSANDASDDPDETSRSEIAEEDFGKWLFSEGRVYFATDREVAVTVASFAKENRNVNNTLAGNRKLRSTFSEMEKSRATIGKLKFYADFEFAKTKLADQFSREMQQDWGIHQILSIGGQVATLKGDQHLSYEVFVNLTQPRQGLRRALSPKNEPKPLIGFDLDDIWYYAMVNVDWEILFDEAASIFDKLYGAGQFERQVIDLGKRFELDIKEDLIPSLREIVRVQLSPKRHTSIMNSIRLRPGSNQMAIADAVVELSARERKYKFVKSRLSGFEIWQPDPEYFNALTARMRAWAATLPESERNNTDAEIEAINKTKHIHALVNNWFFYSLNEVFAEKIVQRIGEPKKSETSRIISFSREEMQIRPQPFLELVFKPALFSSLAGLAASADEIEAMKFANRTRESIAMIRKDFQEGMTDDRREKLPWDNLVALAFFETMNVSVVVGTENYNGIRFQGIVFTSQEQVSKALDQMKRNDLGR